MDPLACYNLMVESYLNDEVEEAQECAENLVNWFAFGGFYPLVLEGVSMAQIKEEVWYVINGIRALEV